MNTNRTIKQRARDIKGSPFSNLACWLRGSLVCLFAAPVWIVAGANVAASDHPNVVVFLSDDQGWGDLSVNGNTNLQTPRIDSLARQGARFDRFYVCPVCSPTRAEFLSGRYHVRSGVYSTSSGGERMNLDEVTIADTFRHAGYATGAFGKWHNGMQYPYHPNGRGFDTFYGFCSGHWGNYFSPPLESNGRLVRGQGFCIDDFTTHALEFMESAHKQGKPFFAYLPFNTPHAPMQVPDPYWDRFKDRDLAMRNRDPQREDIDFTRCALAMCENIDDNVGRVLDQLDAWKISDNTIVIYFCDNGPNGLRWNGEMKGRKGSTDEGGVRSPLLIRWPGHIEPQTEITPIAAAIDLLPTLAQLAGIEIISSKALDGKSLAPLLLDPSTEWPEREIVSFWRGKTSVRNQRFRLDHQGKLFDIQNDPRQDTPVGDKFPEVSAQLKKSATHFKEHIAKGYDDDKRPFLIGNADFQYTQLPARDAQFSGQIQRSNRFPNCSYLMNWISTDDEIFWNARVAAAGRYRVDLYYACKPSDVGSVLELSFGDAKIAAKVVSANDPPLRGQENDRVPRPESYVKDFKPMALGTIDLPAGEGVLKLKAIQQTGKQIIEFRLLMFTRVD